MSRAARAVFLLELRRGRRTLAFGWTAAFMLAAIYSLAQWEQDHPVAILLIVLPGAFGFFAAFAGYGDLMGDRHAGRLTVERALPSGWFTIAGARLAGAGVRSTVAPAIALALAIGLTRNLVTPPRLGTIVALAFAVWVIVTTLCWALMSANVRWSMLRLWWVPTTFWILPQLAPREWWAQFEPQARTTWVWLGATWARPDGPALFIVALIGALALVWVGTAALYASGLRRYVYDPDPLGLLSKRDRAGRAVEYPAGQRSAIMAIALLDVRLGIERLAKQWILFVILVVIAIAGPDTLRSMAPMYIAVLGVMVPGSVMVGVLGARRSGALAAWHHLPQPWTRVAAGKLGGVIVLSLVGAVLLMIGRAVGSPTKPFVSVEFINVVLRLAAGAWLAVVIACWWRRRYLLWLLPGAGAVTIAWAYGGVSMIDAWPIFQRAFTHRAAPLAWFVAVSLLGVPLFAHGLRRYETGRAA